MAIIKCPECGGDISDKAKTCPHCGTPIYICPECKRVSIGSEGVCPHCGYTVSDTLSTNGDKDNGAEGLNNTAEKYIPPIIAEWNTRKKGMPFFEKIKLHIFDILGILTTIPLVIWISYAKCHFGRSHCISMGLIGDCFRYLRCWNHNEFGF